LIGVDDVSPATAPKIGKLTGDYFDVTSPRQRRQKFFLLLVSYVGIFAEVEGRCSTVEISISLS
jgi:hypothetical protein